jgi:hypothetical protein
VPAAEAEAVVAALRQAGMRHASCIGCVMAAGPAGPVVSVAE